MWTMKKKLILFTTGLLIVSNILDIFNFVVSEDVSIDTITEISTNDTTSNDNESYKEYSWYEEVSNDNNNWNNDINITESIDNDTDEKQGEETEWITAVDIAAELIENNTEHNNNERAEINSKNNEVEEIKDKINESNENKSNKIEWEFKEDTVINIEENLEENTHNSWEKSLIDIIVDILKGETDNDKAGEYDEKKWEIEKTSYIFWEDNKKDAESINDEIFKNNTEDFTWDILKNSILTESITWDIIETGFLLNNSIELNWVTVAVEDYDNTFNEQVSFFVEELDISAEDIVWIENNVEIFALDIKFLNNSWYEVLPSQPVHIKFSYPEGSDILNAIEDQNTSVSIYHTNDELEDIELIANVYISDEEIIGQEDDIQSVIVQDWEIVISVQEFSPYLFTISDNNTEDDSLILYYNFNDDNIFWNIVIDLSNQNNTWDANDWVSFSSGSAEFNWEWFIQLSNDYGQLINGANGWSISLWINLENMNNQIIIWSPSWPALWIYSGSYLIWFSSSRWESKPLWIISWLNIWKRNHIVVVFSGNNIDYYINDNHLENASTANYWQRTWSDAFIWSRGNSAWNWLNYFSWYLDEIRIYNRAISDNEISELYNLWFTEWDPKNINITYDANWWTFWDTWVLIVPISYNPIVTKYSHTSNIDDEGILKHNNWYWNNIDTQETITITGAKELTIDITYETESTTYDYIQLLDKNGNILSIDKNWKTIWKIWGTSKTTQQFVISWDTVTFKFHTDSSVSNYYGYYATVSGNQRPRPIKDGFEFQWWYYDTWYDNAFHYEDEIDHPITLYAKREIKKYYIYYGSSESNLRDSNNAVPESNTIEYTILDDITLYTNYKSGYTFNWWRVNSAESEWSWLNISWTITDMHIWQCFWDVKLEYVSTWNPFILNIDDSECSISQNQLNVIYWSDLNAEWTSLYGLSSLPIPTKTWYNFGWYSKEKGSTTKLLSYKSNKVSPTIKFNDWNFIINRTNSSSTIYPIFTKKKITVVFMDSVGRSSNVSSEYLNTITLPTKEASWYIFSWWYNSETWWTLVWYWWSEYLINTDITPIKLYAHYSLIEYPINYHLNWWINNINNIHKYTIESGNVTLGTPTRNYSTFEWRYTDPNYKTRIYTINQGMLGELDVYAKRKCNIWYHESSDWLSCIYDDVPWSIEIPSQIFIPSATYSSHWVSYVKDIIENNFVITEPIWSIENQYITVEATDLEWWVNWVIDKSKVYFKSNWIINISWNDNGNIHIDSQLTNDYVSLERPVRYFYKNWWINTEQSVYWDTPEIMLEIPAYQQPGTYKWKLIVTLYDN